MLQAEQTQTLNAGEHAHICTTTTVPPPINVELRRVHKTCAQNAHPFTTYTQFIHEKEKTQKPYLGPTLLLNATCALTLEHFYLVHSLTYCLFVCLINTEKAAKSNPDILYQNKCHYCNK